MQLVVLIIHLFLAVALIGIVLMQRSEGGALGIGSSGGGMGGFLTGRATANLLTRATAVIAALFIGTSMLLAIMAGGGRSPSNGILNQPRPTAPTAPAKPASPAPKKAPGPTAPSK